MVSTSSSRFRVGFAVLAATAVAACTLLGSRDVIQCRQNKDCAVSSIAGAVCVGGLCSSPANVASPDGDAGDGGGTVPSCSTHTDCDTVDDSAPRLCIEGQCQRLTEKLDDPLAGGCSEILPTDAKTFRDPNAVFVGVYANLAANEPQRALVSYAVTKINEASPSRPLVAVLCNKSKKNPLGALNHLATIQAPVLLGQLEGEDVDRLMPVARERKVALWSTLANTSALQAGNSDGNARFFLDDIQAVGAGFQAALDVADARMRARYESAGTPLKEPDDSPTPIEVVMLVGSGLESDALARELTSTNPLLVNGVSVAVDKSHFHRSTLPVLPNFGDIKPHIIIAVGGDELVAAAPGVTEFPVKTVEGKLPDLGDSSKNPIWIFGPRVRYSMGAIQNLFSAKRNRFMGVDFSGDATKSTAFIDELKSFTNVGVYPAAAFGALYDAIHVVAYAALVPRDGGVGGRLSADELNAALGKFFPTDIADPENPVVSVGPDFGDGRPRMASGVPVRFNGTTGPLEWEKAGTQMASTRKMGHSFYCYRASASTPPLVYYVGESVAAMNAAGCAPDP